MFPAWLHEEGMALDGGGAQRRPNLSDAAQRYLDRLGLGVEDLFHHVLAVLHDPSYREANAGALRMEWPRIPLPGWPDGDAPGAAEELVHPRREAGSLPRCWTRRRPLPASRPARCGRRWPRLPCHQPRTAATWPETTSR